jgi:hypothetical protein
MKDLNIIVDDIHNIQSKEIRITKDKRGVAVDFGPKQSGW